jgi:hypothetical protein
MLHTYSHYSTDFQTRGCDNPLVRDSLLMGREPLKQQTRELRYKSEGICRGVELVLELFELQCQCDLRVGDVDREVREPLYYTDHQAATSLNHFITRSSY